MMDVRYRKSQVKIWREMRRERMVIRRCMWVKGQFMHVDWGLLKRVQKEIRDMRERLFPIELKVEEKMSTWEWDLIERVLLKKLERKS